MVDTQQDSSMPAVIKLSLTHPPPQNVTGLQTAASKSLAHPHSLLSVGLLPAGWLQLNDPLTRALLFVPLFTLLIVRLHRNTLAGSPGLTGVLNLPLLTYLVSTWVTAGKPRRAS
jgi:hypothetical protein